MDEAEAGALLADSGVARHSRLSFDALSLPGYKLDGQWFEGCTFIGTDLAGASLRSALFNGCDFRRADLRGADLTAAHFLACDLRRADLRTADLTGAHFGYTSAPGYHAKLTNLTHALFEGATLDRVVMDRVVGWTGPGGDQPGPVR